MSEKVKLTLLLGGLLAVITALVVTISYINSFQYMTVTFKNPSRPATVELYKSKPGENEHSLDLAEKIQDVTNGERLKLKKGGYAVVTKGNSYDSQVQFISLYDDEETIEYTMRFSKKELASILEREKMQARQSIQDTYPESNTLYRIDGDRILLEGSWYVAFLHYTGPVELSRDTLRVVAHKQNGVWKLMTKPQLALGSPQYPSIPSSVLDYANTILPVPKMTPQP